MNNKLEACISQVMEIAECSREVAIQFIISLVDKGLIEFANQPTKTRDILISHFKTIVGDE